MNSDIYKVKIRGEDQVFCNKIISNIDEQSDVLHMIDIETGLQEFVKREYVDYAILNPDANNSNKKEHSKIVLLMNKEAEEYVLNYYGLLPLSSGFYNIHHSDHQMFSIAFYHKEGFNKEKFEQLFDDFFVIDLLNIT